MFRAEPCPTKGSNRPALLHVAAVATHYSLCSAIFQEPSAFCLVCGILRSVLNSHAGLTAYHLGDASDVTWDIWGNLQIDLLDRADRLAKLLSRRRWTSSTIFPNTGCSTWTMQLTATDFGNKPSPMYYVQYIHAYIEPGYGTSARTGFPNGPDRRVAPG